MQANKQHKLEGRSRSASWRVQLQDRGLRSWQKIQSLDIPRKYPLSSKAFYAVDDAIHCLAEIPECSIQAIVTDPPYGLVEYEEAEIEKRTLGRGGVWRIPPSFDGVKRSPLPRFTVLSSAEIENLHSFFNAVAYGALRALVPGGHVVIASNPLLSSMCFHAFQEAGFEKRGEFIRLVQTLRGGDRPKGAESEFKEVSVMPRACWEPWGIFRKPLEGTVAENLRVWGTGGLRRVSDQEPLKDVIPCSPTRGVERLMAPHPSLKPQRFLRQVVRAVLPLEHGIIYDPFAGSGSTLAAAEHLGFYSFGTDRSAEYAKVAQGAFNKLARLDP